MKRGVGVLIVISILVLPLVAAGIFDWFKGDVQEAPEVEVAVTLTNVPPNIVGLHPVSDRECDDASTAVGSDDDGEVQPIDGTDSTCPTDGDGIVYAMVTFVVEDSDGQADLPASVSVAAGDIAVDITSPANGILSGARTLSAADGSANYPTGATATCAGTNCGAGNAWCNPGDEEFGSGDETNQKSYTCFVKMRYFDETIQNAPNPTGPGDMWTIDMYIEDSTGNSDTATSTDFGSTFPGDEDYYVWYRTVSEIDVTPGERILWSSVSVILPDHRSEDDNAGDGADTGLTFENMGNQVIDTVDIQPQDLCGTVQGCSNAQLEAEAMSVGTTEPAAAQGSNTGACEETGAGTPLDPDSPESAYGPGGWDVPFTSQGGSTDNNELYFCIWSRLDSSSNCDGGACLTGPVGDNTYDANGPCSGPCDSDGEYWVFTGNT